MSHDEAASPESIRTGAQEAATRVRPAPRLKPPRQPVGQWMGHAANIGALVGLMLVVVQLQQTRELMRAQIRHELAAGIVDLLQVPAASSQLASVLRRAEQGDSLGPDEAFQFRLRSNALLRYWEDVHYQYRQGLYVEEEFSRQRLAWANSLQRSIGLVRYWCTVRTLYSPPFAAEIDALLPAKACSPA